jgi:NAD dependent epimerase/dehydratase
MKKFLVTGADGFIGSHLVEYLVENNYEVIALVQYNSFNSWGWLDNTNLASHMKIVAGDIRDKSFCLSITKNVEKIFNLAALVSIPFSYVAPSSYFETNAMGTLNLCEASITNSVNDFIQMSTSEVYGSAQYLPIDELHPLNAQSPYSASKISAETIVTSFNKSFNLNTKIARVFNTYGPRQSSRAIIPTVISQLLSTTDYLDIGSLEPTRDLNYVEDTCNNLVSLGNSSKANGMIINLGSNTKISMGELVKKISTLIGIKKDISIQKDRIRPINSEVRNLQCDNNLMKSIINFQPKYTLDEGLVKTIEWFSKPENLKFYKTNIYNI